LKGVRSQLYYYADKHLGYYEAGRPGIYYETRPPSEDKDPHLKFHIIFETKENALRYESEVRQSANVLHSPLCNLLIQTSLEELSRAVVIGTRIFSSEYDPTENEDSPGQTTIYSDSYHFSTVDDGSDLFKYQRIESEEVFSSFEKAQSCHLISKAHCRKFPTTYAAMETALSVAMHGYFDGFTQSNKCELFCLSYVGHSETVVVDGRYRVDLLIEVFNIRDALHIFPRLNVGSSKTDKPSTMKTFVHVKNPKKFKACIDWKEENTRRHWDALFPSPSEK
jgi:hypothetical protein